MVALNHAHPIVLGRWHQTTTDAYTAQHVGPDTLAITVWFALNSLHLVLERGLSGVRAREAHGRLANTQPPSEWAPLIAPPDTGTLTVLEPALAGTGRVGRARSARGRY